MKQSAVEWLFSELLGERVLSKELIELREQAKEMEKQQIIEAVDETNSKWKSQKAEIILSGEHCYETFKK